MKRFYYFSAAYVVFLLYLFSGLCLCENQSRENTIAALSEFELKSHLRILDTILENRDYLFYGLLNIHGSTTLTLGLSADFWKQLDDEKRLSLFSELNDKVRILKTSELSNEDREKVIKGILMLPEENHWAIVLGNYESGEFQLGEILVMGALEDGRQVINEADKIAYENFIKSHQHFLESTYLQKHESVLQKILKEHFHISIGLRNYQDKTALFLGLTNDTWNSLSEQEKFKHRILNLFKQEEFHGKI
ncbi:MAG: hypothetical protein A2Y62_12795 [Candidatus Fischerbacteria bacterium RBG_13_37_8]|uniref:Uncharacterized protein n=1 Tax=Candidatus Fischerbacteria bacterium RBG_13_37_8 TaxID=1817863 RepID=A0A1F5VQ98_9BACT|nr:MAG: hypothetical protein A2Y62_12795 [Candidatus Fischerbacteria bacterium RBG_13_37_8]